MRILIDCDVLLDVAMQRSPHDEQSGKVLDWAERHPGLACVAWHSLANISYLYRGNARDFIEELLRFVEVAPVSTIQMRQALASDMSDLEDAMQTAAAGAFAARAIVTRNTSDYKRSPVKAMLPSDFLKTLVGR